MKTNNKPSEQRAKETILRNHLLPAFGATPLDAINGLDIEEYKAAHLADGFSPKTINNQLAILRKCLQTAVDWGNIERFPKIVLLRTIPPERDFLSVEEAARLVDGADEPMWRAMILTALRTGMRLGELFGLDWSDVDMERGIIVVRRSIVRGIVSSPKTHKERLVAFPASVAQALRPFQRPSGLVFCRADGQALSHHIAENALHRSCRQAGLRLIGWHTLRHSCASQLAMLRGTVLEAQRLLGHSSIAMTERYTHLLPSLLHDAVATLDRAAATVGRDLGNRQSAHASEGPFEPQLEAVLDSSLLSTKQKTTEVVVPIA